MIFPIILIQPLPQPNIQGEWQKILNKVLSEVAYEWVENINVIVNPPILPDRKWKIFEIRNFHSSPKRKI